MEQRAWYSSETRPWKLPLFALPIWIVLKSAIGRSTFFPLSRSPVRILFKCYFIHRTCPKKYNEALRTSCMHLLRPYITHFEPPWMKINAAESPESSRTAALAESYEITVLGCVECIGCQVSCVQWGFRPPKYQVLERKVTQRYVYSCISAM